MSDIRLDALEDEVRSIRKEMRERSGEETMNDRKMRDLLMNLDQDNIPSLKKIVKTISENGKAIAVLTQEVDDFGASYSSYLAYMMSGGYVIGEYSPTNALSDTSDLPKDILYYPVSSHTEGGTSFDISHVYQWNGTEWTVYGDVTVSETIPSPAVKDSYWYCTQDQKNGEKEYYSEFLYRYDGENWIYVGNKDSNTSFMYSNLYQNVTTAKSEIGLLVGDGKLCDGEGNISAGVLVSTINGGTVYLNGNVIADGTLSVGKLKSAEADEGAGTRIYFQSGISFSSIESAKYYNRVVQNAYQITFYNMDRSVIGNIGYGLDTTETNFVITSLMGMVLSGNSVFIHTFDSGVPSNYVAGLSIQPVLGTTYLTLRGSGQYAPYLLFANNHLYLYYYVNGSITSKILDS